jgi:hypothetical protein
LEEVLCHSPKFLATPHSLYSSTGLNLSMGRVGSGLDPSLYLEDDRNMGRDVGWEMGL